MSKYLCIDWGHSTFYRTLFTFFPIASFKKLNSSVYFIICHTKVNKYLCPIFSNFLHFYFWLLITFQAVVKALESLAAKGSVREKTYGKQKVYVADQVNYEISHNQDWIKDWFKMGFKGWGKLYAVNQLNFACDLISRFLQIRQIKFRKLYCRACSLGSGTN